MRETALLLGCSGCLVTELCWFYLHLTRTHYKLQTVSFRPTCKCWTSLKSCIQLEEQWLQGAAAALLPQCLALLSCLFLNKITKQDGRMWYKGTEERRDCRIWRSNGCHTGPSKLNPACFHHGSESDWSKKRLIIWFPGSVVTGKSITVVPAQFSPYN